MEERTQVVYVAKDGEIFIDKVKCLEYEAELKLQSFVAEIQYFGSRVDLKDFLFDYRYELRNLLCDMLGVPECDTSQ